MTLSRIKKFKTLAVLVFLKNVDKIMLKCTKREIVLKKEFLVYEGY